MKIAAFLAMILGLILTFQNCSSSGEDPGYFVADDTPGANSGFASTDCYADVCVEPAETLWLKIKEANPYTINLFYNTSGHFDVGGTCSSGDFTQHTLRWELRQLAGAQAIEGEGFVDQACSVGRFSIAIAGNLAIESRYELTVEILGVDQAEQLVTNPLRSNVSRVDVVIINENTNEDNGEPDPPEDP